MCAPGSGTSHWRVVPWSGGTTTEPGSSGSPIYDPQGRILGQLHGGYAACGKLLPDWYGRIGISWTGGGTDATRLSTWLDPNNTGVETIFGFDPILDVAEPEAPAAIADLNIVADAEGALLASLSWTNPSLTFEGETLTQLDTIKIFKAGELIHTILEPVIGVELQYTDNNITEAGNYIYTLRAYNAFGSSPPANSTLYIGPDVPAAVNDVGKGGSANSDLELLAAGGTVFMFNGTMTSCEGTFFESGGPDSNYQNNENFTLTFFPETEGAKINMQFNSFNTESEYDYLYVYNDDEAIESYLIGQFSGIGVPELLQNITSTHVTGALTFRFTSDFSVTRPGWQADISCVPGVYMVTFSVDMSKVPYLIFDGDTDNIYITGSMTGWAEPGNDPANLLMQPFVDDENIYSIKLQMQSGNYEYKYFINAGWDNGEWDGSPNRTIGVTADMTVNDEFVVLEPGDQPWQYAWMQFIHNVADAEAIDITLNGKSFIADIFFRHATEFLSIPAGHEFLLQVSVSDNDSREILHAQNVNFIPDEAGVAILGGLTSEERYNPFIPVSIAYHEGRMETITPDNADLLIFHGSTDAPEVSVRLEEQSEPLFAFEYGDFSGYYELPTSDYRLYVQPVEGAEVIYLAPLETLNLQGDALVVVASGFYEPQNNQDGLLFGLWVALSQGGAMAELTILTSIYANLTQTGDIILYPNPAMDYVQVSSGKTISELQIVGMNGKVRFHANPSSKGYILNTANLPAGVFFIRVIHDTGISVNKLIIKQ